MTVWNAIRTMPGAQQPQREYAIETTALAKNGKPRGKGYRIVPSLNPNQSAVERALADAGFVAYMPAEFKVVRSRTKAWTYTLRRFPLLSGYVFVHGVTDWFGLLGSDNRNGVPGVAGVVSIDGCPLPIAISDIMLLRTEEAKSLAKADKLVSSLNNTKAAASAKEVAKALAAAKRRYHAQDRVRLLWGKHAGREAIIIGWENSELKAIVDRLEGAETISVPHDAVRMVA